MTDADADARIRTTMPCHPIIKGAREWERRSRPNPNPHPWPHL